MKKLLAATLAIGLWSGMAAADADLNSRDNFPTQPEGTPEWMVPYCGETFVTLPVSVGGQNNWLMTTLRKSDVSWLAAADTRGERWAHFVLEDDLPDTERYIAVHLWAWFRKCLN